MLSSSHSNNIEQCIKYRNVNKAIEYSSTSIFIKYFKLPAFLYSLGSLRTCFCSGNDYYQKECFYALKGTFPGLKQFLATGRLLKMMKNFLISKRTFVF